MATKGPSLLAKLTQPHISFKDREYFTENLALLLKAAVPVSEALASMASAAHGKAMKNALARMQLDVDAGSPLAVTIEKSGLVSGQTLALIRLGEQSGHLVENLKLAAQQEEKRHIFQAKIRSALLYPVFVLSVTMIVALGVAWFLLPRLNDTFSQLHVHLPVISRIMLGAGVFLKQHGAIIIPGTLVFMGVLVYVIFFMSQTRWIGQRILNIVPGIGRLMREVEVAQFGYLYGTLLEAGLPITQSASLLATSSSSLRHQALYRYLAGALEDGYSIKDALSRYKHSEQLLPSAVQQMVIAGERSGSLSDVLLVIGHTYEQKADVTTENLESIIEPVLLLFVAGGVLLVAASVLLPIYSLLGGLNR